MSSSKTSESGSVGFQTYKFERMCYNLVNSENYFQAASQLKRLQELQPGHFWTMLMLGKSYINLDKFDAAFEVAKQLREAMLHKPRPEAREVILQAMECAEAEKYFMSLVLLWCACAIYKEERKPNDALYGIGECLFKMDTLGFGLNATDNPDREAEIVQYRQRFASFFTLLMEDIESQLKSFGDIDSDIHLVVLMRCLGNKADCSFELDRYNEAIEQFKFAIDQLMRQLGSNASKCYMLGEFLMTTGICYSNLDDNETCKSYLNRAQVAVKESEPVSEGEMVFKQQLIKVLAELLTPKKSRIGKIFGVFKK